MIFTPQQYIKAPPIILPYESPTGLTIDDLQGQCKNCHKPAKDLRGFITEHSNCMELKYAGVCHECKLITSYHLRHYKDGRVQSCGDNGWCEMVDDSWFSLLIDKIKNILSFS